MAGLIKYFQAEKASQLKGKTFETFFTGEPDYEIQYLSRLGDNEDYKPPSQVEIYNKTVISLARKEVPNFSMYDPYSVNEAWWALVANKSFPTSLKKDVEKKSGGKIKIRDAEIEEFGEEESVLCRIRLALVEDNEEQLFSISYTENPVIFHSKIIHVK